MSNLDWAFVLLLCFYALCIVMLSLIVRRKPKKECPQNVTPKESAK